VPGPNARLAEATPGRWTHTRRRDDGPAAFAPTVPVAPETRIGSCGATGRLLVAQSAVAVTVIAGGPGATEFLLDGVGCYL
jgi:hypothetical protein